MALKDSWKPKVDGVDDVSASDINDIANTLIAVESDKVNKEEGKGLSTNDFKNEDKASLHTHKNKSTLDGITDEKIQSWDNKSDFNGSYNSLRDKPAIPSTAGLASEKYVDDALKNIDLSGFVTKENGKGLSSNDFTNEDKEAIHTHSNKEILEEITEDKINEWNEKADREDLFELEAKLKYYGTSDIEITPAYRVDEDVPDDVEMCLLYEIDEETQTASIVGFHAPIYKGWRGSEETDYDGREEKCYSVVVPYELDGYPVTKIGEYAFSNWVSDRHFHTDDETEDDYYLYHGVGSIILPNTITDICDSAFAECCELYYVNLPEGIKHIGTYILEFVPVKELTIPSTLETCDYPFDSSEVETVKIASGMTKIPDKLLGYAYNLKHVVMPSTVEEIGECAFTACYALKGIELSYNVKKIGAYAFTDGCAVIFLHKSQHIGEDENETLDYDITAFRTEEGQQFVSVFVCQGSIVEKWCKENGITYKYTDVDPESLSVHSHDNKDVLDGITEEKVKEWDNKSGGTGGSQWKTLIDTTLTEEQGGVSSIYIAIPNWEILKTATRMRLLVDIKSGENAIESQTLQAVIKNNGGGLYSSVLLWLSAKCDENKKLMTRAAYEIFPMENEESNYFGIISPPTIYTGANAGGNMSRVNSSMNFNRFKENPPYLHVCLVNGGIMATGTRIFLEVYE